MSGVECNEPQKLGVGRKEAGYHCGVAVYHFTLHAMGSWKADHPRGFTVRGEGYRPPDPDEQRRREESLSQPVIEFDERMQRVLVAGTYDICRRRQWELYGAGNDPTHFHALIGWHHFVDWQEARDQLKNILSLFLGRWTGIQGRTWFVEGGSRKRVTTPKHFHYLLTTYFPDHRGVFWKRGMPLPQIPEWVLTGKGKPGASAPGYEEENPSPPDSR
jgi:hypothetical protein